MKMKKPIVAAIVVALALALALPMAAAPAVTLAANGDPIVYGMQRDSAKIYPINPRTGTVGTPINTGLTGSSAGPNGLAYDSDNDVLYYTTYPGFAKLYYWDTATTSSVYIGDLGPRHRIADADFYDGKYYYINHHTDDLYEVAVSGGVISGTNSYTSISGDEHAWEWGGDIAVSPEGVIYAVGNCKGTHNKYEFFKVNRDGTGFTMIDPDIYSFSLQLAFGLDGKLYGHESRGSGNFYEINLTNGDLSAAFPNATNYLYTDCASGPRNPGDPEVAIDIKPTSCPNPLNTKSKGVLPVAILGTETFDVTQIDPASVKLGAEGFDPLKPDEWVAPLRWAFEDVATPFEGIPEECLDCTDEGPDGYMDLTLKFSTQEVVTALGTVEDGQCLVLTLTGNLLEDYGGTPIEGQDVVRIIKKGKK